MQPAKPPPSDPELAERCVLQHPAFTRLGHPTFRRAESDGTPMMTVRLGEKDASIPLQSLQREFGIGHDTPDGRMLGLIAQSLDFVALLQLGDLLPAEVLTGEASWDPTPMQRQIATVHLLVRLVAWLTGAPARDGVQPDPEALLALVEDPAFRPQVQQAFHHAATALELPDAEAVVALIGQLAQELAHIEALRERLLHPVQALTGTLAGLRRHWRGDGTHAETLTQVQRLAVQALKQIDLRFQDIDGRTSEVLSALHSAQGPCPCIRAHRDWLYRSLLGWQPILQQWDEAAGMSDRELWVLIERTYHFLAPRFMAVTEWTPAGNATRPGPAARARMVW